LGAHAARISGRVTFLLQPFDSGDIAVAGTAIAVIIALVVAGSVSAPFGRARKLRTMARTVGGAIMAMAVTYGIGALVGG
jgi:VIT1/CCC1 family predicted Fe2+/Mn2+ transporter